MISTDRWGAPAAGDSASIAAWEQAWDEALYFVADPFATLADANEADHSFALGSVFCGTYRVLGGTPRNDPDLMADVERATTRATTERDTAHAAALRHLVAGNFAAAAFAWHQLNERFVDFAATRFAHDVWLHIGDNERRLMSSQRAFDRWDEADPGWGFIASQHSFSLGEVGRIDESLELGYRALAVDARDVWATHALAHAHETRGNVESAIDLLTSTSSIWQTQAGLAVHMWWHLSLRLIAAERYDDALAVHDAQVPHATTAFRLCDLVSLLWRLELVGVDVGQRWDHLADAVAQRPERHTVGFLDVHAAFVFQRRPDHPYASEFHAGIASAFADDSSENGEIFRTVVRPLCDAIRQLDADPSLALAALKALEATSHHIGGSNAQRDLLLLTAHQLERLEA